MFLHISSLLRSRFSHVKIHTPVMNVTNETLINLAAESVTSNLGAASEVGILLPDPPADELGVVIDSDVDVDSGTEGANTRTLDI